MALNPSGAISLAGPVAGQSIALELGLSPTAVISLNDTAVRTLAGVPSGTIIMPTNFWGKSSYIQTQRGCIAYGQTSPTVSSVINTSVLITNTAVAGAIVAGVGTARQAVAGSTYGGDKGIMMYGSIGPGSATQLSISNLVSNTGVVAGDTPAAGTSRNLAAATNYSSDKAFVAYGQKINFPAAGATIYNTTNLISNTGVIASDTPGAGQKTAAGALTYGIGKGIIAYGLFNYTTPLPTYTAVSQLVSDTGVFSGTTATAGTARDRVAGLAIGSDTGIFVYGTAAPGGAYGFLTSTVSNTGVLSSSSNIPAPAASARQTGGAKYGGDKAFTAYGFATPSSIRVMTLFSNTGVATSQANATSPSRQSAGIAGFSST